MLSEVRYQRKVTLLGGTPMQKLLATSWHPGGVNAIIPVIKKMQEDRKMEVIVLGHEFSEPILSKAGITFKTIKDFGLTDVSHDSMQKILEQVSPALVLMGTASQEGRHNDVIEHTITRAARNKGVKT